MSLHTLEEAVGLPVERVGGKAAGLARLVSLGLPVPPAVVLDVCAHARYLQRGEMTHEDAAALANAAAALGRPLAVRSSATDEDIEGRSAAGQYESVMGVGGSEALVSAVRRCWEAADSERARAYRGGGGADVALVIQRQVQAGRAGVAFSADPVTGSAEAIVIEAVFGHGEGIVSGQVSPDRYELPRAGGAVRARRADKRVMSDGAGPLRDVAPQRRLARCLRDDEVVQIAELVLRAESGFGAPVDVEFCLEGERLWLVQCRPITTLHAAA